MASLLIYGYDMIIFPFENLVLCKSLKLGTRKLTSGAFDFIRQLKKRAVMGKVCWDRAIVNFGVIMPFWKMIPRYSRFPPSLKVNLRKKKNNSFTQIPLPPHFFAKVSKLFSLFILVISNKVESDCDFKTWVLCIVESYLKNT